MIEVLELPQIQADRYQAFVLSTRFASADPSRWAGKSADYIEEEAREFLSQHGPGEMMFLYPDAPYTNELRYKMGDEMSDMFWFGADVANWLGEDIATVCSDALSIRTQRQTEPAYGFAEMQERIVASEYHMTLPDPSDIDGVATLAKSPLYAFVYSVSGLGQALRDHQTQM